MQYMAASSDQTACSSQFMTPQLVDKAKQKIIQEESQFEIESNENFIDLTKIASRQTRYTADQQKKTNANQMDVAMEWVWAPDSFQLLFCHNIYYLPLIILSPIEAFIL